MLLHSQIIGEGKPFVILHGFLGMGDNWKTLGNQFADAGFQVHLVDQRNHGRSFHDPTFNYQVMAADLLAYCNYYKLDKIFLLGHSMGGKTAMQFAMEHPDMIEKLMIADIAPKEYPLHHQDILKGLASLNFQEITSRGEADEALAVYIPHLGTRMFLLKNLYWVKKGVLGLRINLPVLTKNIEEVGKSLASEKKYNGKTLFIKGEKSGYILPMDKLAILHQFPNSKIVSIPNAGHWLHAENAEAFYQQIIAFVK